jgi:hypothetical protein
MTAHFLTWFRSQADGAALQELAGWETEKMVRRYAHFAADHLAAHADKLEIHGQTRHEHRISVAQRNSNMLKTKWSARSPTRHADFSSACPERVQADDFAAF